MSKLTVIFLIPTLFDKGDLVKNLIQEYSNLEFKHMDLEDLFKNPSLKYLGNILYLEEPDYTKGSYCISIILKDTNSVFI